MKVKQPFEIPHEVWELSRAAARQRIDDDIDELKRTIRSLKTKRNELCPISLLPPELLSKIFIFARDWSRVVRILNQKAPWIRVGHVCRHWREVALGCPNLWSTPVFTMPDLAQEMIQRSKSAPLTIRSTTSSWTPRVFGQLDHALAQIHRIQSIELTLGFDIEKFKTIFSSLSQPAPLLEKISLWSASTNDNPFLLPLDTLSDAPRLRSIGFHDFNFSWGSAALRHRSLIELRLSSDVATSNSATVGQMMDVLCNLPNLRILELINSIPSHRTSHGNEKILELKSLELLEVSGEAVDCIFLLRHIQYPPCTTVILSSSATAVEDGATILSLVGQNLRRTRSVKAGTPHSTIIRLARLTSDMGDTEIKLFDNFDSMKHLPLPSDPIIALHLGNSSYCLHDHSRHLKIISDCFDLSSLQGLLLDWSFPGNETHVIRDFLGKLPKVEVLEIHNSLPQICSAISESITNASIERLEETQASTHPSRKSPHSDPPHVTVLPALKTLVIECMDFRQRYHPEGVKYLTEMLKRRSDNNARIDRLSLERSLGLRTWQKKWLGELVVDLEVDDELIDVEELDSDDDEDDEDDEYALGEGDYDDEYALGEGDYDDEYAFGEDDYGYDD